MRRRTLFPALLAAVLQATAPLLAGAAPATALDHVELCTAQGVVTVAAGDSGAPANSLGAHEHCAACSVQAPAAPPAVSPITLQSAEPLASTMRPVLPDGAALLTGARPRAPPAA